MCDFEKCTKPELIAIIKKLTAHNKQLKNIIKKSEKPVEQPQNRAKRVFDFEKCKFQHVLFKLIYLGWHYDGFVTQENTTNTIEHHIFEALTKTCLIEAREKSNYHRCGRTDKGVSSFSQVISLDVRCKSDDIKNEMNYCKMLNSVLPNDIQFVAWTPVPQNFSARFDCNHRTYKYFFPKGDLNTEKIKIAIKYLVGSHDFRNFCKMDVNNGVVEFIRNILYTDLTSLNDDSIQVFTIKGNAFLWHQIRCIIGILILIGQEKESPEVILELLDVKNNPRKPDYYMASEIPLNLYDCHYDDIDWFYEKENLNVVATKLQQFWAFSSIKSSMIKSILDDLQNHENAEPNKTSDCIISGTNRKNYVPVMKRQLCESLETKLESALTKKKMKHKHK